MRFSPQVLQLAFLMQRFLLHRLAFRGTHVFNRSAGDRVLSGRRWRELQRGLREGLACRPSMRPACDYGCCRLGGHLQRGAERA